MVDFLIFNLPSHLPSQSQKGLPIGQHLSLKFEEEDEESGKAKVRLADGRW